MKYARRTRYTRHTRYARSAALAAVGLVATLSLTACNPDEASGGGSPDSSASSSGGSSQGSGGNGGNGENADNGDNGGEDGEAPRCKTDEIGFKADDNSHGDVGVVGVSLYNRSDHLCTIKGFAGATLKTNHGDMDLERNGDTPQLQKLKPEEFAAFDIHFSVNKTGGRGITPTKILVTPPDERTSGSVAWPSGSLPVSDEAEPLTITPLAEEHTPNAG